MRAIEVTDRNTLNMWHKVPSIIYANDPNWIPHLRQDIDKIFDPAKNKLLQEGGAAVRYIFYGDDGRLQGRVAAFVNPRTAHKEEQPTGGMGFFECIDHYELAAFIFDTCRDWLKNKGMEAMDGPVNFGERNQFWGCLTKNFTDPNSYAMNYNPPYYPAFFERYGFGVFFEQYLYTRDAREPAQPIFVRKYAQLTGHFKLNITNIEGMDLSKVAEDFRTVYNGAWGGHAGFKEMTPEAAQKIMLALKPVIDPRIIIFVYDGQKPIAFYVNIPELNEIFNKVHGNLNLWGKLVFLYHKWRRTPRTLVGIVFGVVKEWQGRGVEGAMIKFMSDQILAGKVKYTRTVLQWIGDFNPKMLRVCENLGATRYREMKTYRFLFDRNKDFKRCAIVE
jgi:GNAT superfamily N-acetyltransferase